jgi:glycosyltransferase involved in cell wall biosynthesis
VYTHLVAMSARRATCVLTDSESARDDIVTHLQIPSQKIRVAYLAADSRYRPVSDATRMAEVRKKYALPNHYVLYLGGFDVRKNVPGILRAFASLDQSEVRLVIAGKLPDSDSLMFPDPRRIADRLGITDRVHLTGWIKERDKPALYSGARAFVFPSLYEGFGLPPLEAMACGTPAIVSNRSSLPEVVGQGGLLVDPASPAEIATAIRQMTTDQSLHDRLSRAALQRAAYFSWERTVRGTLDAYQCAVLS